MMKRIVLLAGVWVGALLAPTQGLSAAAPIDAAAVRDSARSAVCRVTAENAWGIPEAIATGFLLGDGRFVVTDLGAVGRPGAAQVSLQFQDGSKSVAREFGMADPALGLVLLRMPADAPARTGLALAAELPVLDGTAPVIAAGWHWGSQLEVVAGRLWKGPAMRDLAPLARVEPPAGVDTFVRMEGGRLEAAGGSPLLGSSGTVLAVGFDLLLRDTVAPLGMPATTLRSALLATPPQLKPLAELPKPLWPQRPLRMPGSPATQADITAAASRFKTALLCQMCKGTGRITGEGPGRGLISRFFDGHFPCPTCHGELVTASEVSLKALSTLAEQATRTVWVPVADDRARAAARATAADILKAMAGYGPHFRRDHAAAVAAALHAAALPPPWGIVCQAQVTGADNGPDGRYVFLSPWSSRATLAVRADDLVMPGYKTAVRREPPADSWVLLTGAVLSRFKADSREGFFVLPCEWLSCTAPPPPEPDDRRPPFGSRDSDDRRPPPGPRDSDDRRPPSGPRG
ncbi:MAG: hypothetical protein NTX87_07675 [Planctomycetota bacterium]|nr:hypothetical protein [Planctomycetota bacterium]